MEKETDELLNGKTEIKHKEKSRDDSDVLTSESRNTYFLEAHETYIIYTEVPSFVTIKDVSGSRNLAGTQHRKWKVKRLIKWKQGARKPLRKKKVISASRRTRQQARRMRTSASVSSRLIKEAVNVNQEAQRRETLPLALEGTRVDPTQSPKKATSRTKLIVKTLHFKSPVVELTDAEEKTQKRKEAPNSVPPQEAEFPVSEQFESKQKDKKKNIFRHIAHLFTKCWTRKKRRVGPEPSSTSTVKSVRSSPAYHF
ncbi:hypothetical protein Bpfe_003300 [Biomphalaria pfeifferi]|uniref:Uncharacterized protein n=1 Tax=Biomphalaria pfeifferi TaxID=112525 RepID=A0AAD8FJE7_BIOPF|nr:hypothetical protein Bpfe_003300 [Biomphalaria pfeifferi]